MPLSPLRKSSKGNSFRLVSRAIGHCSLRSPTHPLIDWPEEETYPDFQGMEEEYDLSKMSEPEGRTDPELDDLRPQNDRAAIAIVGLSEFGMSAPVAERIH